MVINRADFHFSYLYVGRMRQKRGQINNILTRKFQVIFCKNLHTRCLYSDDDLFILGGQILN